MLQTLKKQSRKKILLKIKIRNFIKKQLWVYLLVISSIMLCAWLFNKWIEGIMFCIAHICIRNTFDKQFHFNKLAYCITLTMAIVWFAIPITLPLSLSLLSSIPIAFLVCFFGFLAQDRLDLYKRNKALKEQIDKVNNQINELLAKIRHKDIYSMNEQELYEHCRNCGLDDVECKIAYYVVIERLKGKELYEAIDYSEAQAKRKRSKILNTIK